MPLIKNSTYTQPPFYLFNGHLETIVPSVWRKVEGVQYERERLELADGDFVDLDWVKKGNERLMILTHGLEGNSERHYIKGMVKLLQTNQWDALAWNCRSCSGEMNRLLRMYHHGDIEDIGSVIEHVQEEYHYKEICLIGFSMGGNITLKYLGVHGKSIPANIKGGVAISAPCDLTSSAELLDQPKSYFYKQKFYKKLSAKMRLKAAQFPGVIDMNNLKKVKCWKDFDEYFSAPINGFKDAQDFYDQASSINYIEGIQIPTLLVNAQNDPILTPSCFPTAIAHNHPYLFLETPRRGGHVSFVVSNQLHSWIEKRSLQFLNALL